jgi:transcriptional regulator with XRE-family HTH domain
MNEPKTSRRQRARIGRSLQDFRADLERQDPEYAAAAERLGTSVVIANMVTASRARLAMTQDELAVQMGTTKSAISRLESGRHLPNIDTVQRLANVLGVTVVIQPALAAEGNSSDAEQVILRADFQGVHDLRAGTPDGRLVNR